jgi:hypothetical protein
MTAAFDPIRALRVLLEHEVRFVVIGGIAGRAWGSPSVTNDIDVCYDRSLANREALARALTALQATLRGAPPGLPFILHARTLGMGDSFTFETTAGAVDCLATPAGTRGYADLAERATRVELDAGVHVLIAALDDVIRMKRAAGRPKDRIELEILEAVRRRRDEKPPNDL